MIDLKPAKFIIFPFLHSLRALLFAAVSGSIVGLCYSLLTGSLHGGMIFGSIQSALALGAIIGVNIVALERYVLEPLLRRFSFIVALLITALAYSVIAIFWLWLFESGVLEFGAKESKVSFWKEYRNIFLPYDILFAVAASFSYLLLIEIRSLLAPDFLRKYLTGKYHTPCEEERIFMFLDLRSSTALAEQLGNYKYSCLLQEIFRDLTIPILASKAEVYQYVGDEVILTWTHARGLQKNRCINCFFHIQRIILSKSEKYRPKYGTVPEMKAGMHIGKAISVCVGEIKKEIVYHGDVLNTTARIQSLCNQLKQDLIISEALRDALPDTEILNTEVLAETALRGKNRPIELYAVSEKNIS
jgi:adenylate cyclase